MLHRRLRDVDLVHSPSLAVPPRGGVPLVVTVARRRADAVPRHVPATWPMVPPHGHRGGGPARRPRDRTVTGRGRRDRRAQRRCAPSGSASCTKGSTSSRPGRRGRRRPSGSGLGDAPYVLWVGTLEPRKNVRRDRAAFRAVVAAGLPHDLVLVGSKGWLDAADAIRGPVQRARRTGPRHRPCAGRRCCARSTAAPTSFALAEPARGVRPSRARGDGAGHGGVCSDIPVLREVAADAGTYVPARDVDALGRRDRRAAARRRRDVLASRRSVANERRSSRGAGPSTGPVRCTTSWSDASAPSARYQPRSTHSWRCGRSSSDGRVETVAGQHEVVGREGEQASVDRRDDLVEARARRRRVARTAREQRVALNTTGLSSSTNDVEPLRVPGRVHRAQPQVADLEHVVVGDHEVVGGQHLRVTRRDADVDARVADRRHGLDVVPVTVRRQHAPHARRGTPRAGARARSPRRAARRRRCACSAPRTRCSRTARRRASRSRTSLSSRCAGRATEPGYASGANVCSCAWAVSPPSRWRRGAVQRRRRARRGRRRRIVPTRGRCPARVRRDPRRARALVCAPRGRGLRDPAPADEEESAPTSAWVGLAYDAEVDAAATLVDPPVPVSHLLTITELRAPGVSPDERQRGMPQSPSRRARLRPHRTTARRAGGRAGTFGAASTRCCRRCPRPARVLRDRRARAGSAST